MARYVILEAQSRVKLRETSADPPSFDPGSEIAVAIAEGFLLPHGPWRLKADNATWEAATEAQIVQSGVYAGEIEPGVTVSDLLRRDRNAGIEGKALAQDQDVMFEKNRVEAGYDTIIKAINNA